MSATVATDGCTQVSQTIQQAWTASWCTAAYAGVTANSHRNLLADNSWNANGYFVRNANRNSLANLNRLLLADWYTYCVSDLLADVFANIAAHGVALSLALSNHCAGGVANVFGALFANPVGDAVVDRTSTALRNHAACGVVNCTLTWLANSLANGVVYSLAAALRYHFAGRVVDGTLTWLAHSAAYVVGYRAAAALRNHLASRIVYSLAAALRNHAAHCVRNGFRYAATLVACAVDFFGFAGWNPNLLAYSPWWALNTFDMARTWAVNATALRRVPYPRSWCADNATLYRTSYFFRYRIPMSAIDLHCTSVVDRRSDVANYFTGTSFLLRNHDRVVYYAAVALLHWVHNGVVDNSLTSLNNRLTHGVVDDFAVSFVYRCHDRVVDDLAAGLVYRLLDGVVDDLAVGLVHRLHYCVVDLTSAGLSYWTAYVVGYLTSLSRIYRFVDRVGSSLGLVDRLADNGVNRSVTCLTLHASYIDYLVFGNRLILGACALLCLLFVDSSTDILHDSVRSWTTAVGDDVSTALIAHCAAVSGIGLTSVECY